MYGNGRICITSYIHAVSGTNAVQSIDLIIDRKIAQRNLDGYVQCFLL